MNDESPNRTWLARTGCRWVPCGSVSDKKRWRARRQDDAMRATGGDGAGARNSKTICLLRRYVIDSCSWPFGAGNRQKSFEKQAANQSEWRKKA